MNTSADKNSIPDGCPVAHSRSHQITAESQRSIVLVSTPGSDTSDKVLVEDVFYRARSRSQFLWPYYLWVVFVLLAVGLPVAPAHAAGNVSSLYKPVPASNVSITVSDTRVTSDRVDGVTGFQVKAIYVVPADGVDNSYDTNGYIAGILDEGNSYLREQLGLQVPIDKHASGYDIQYLKSNFTTADMRASDDLIEKLLVESLVFENPGLNRKNFIFFIDVSDLGLGAACGWGNMPGLSAVVAVGKGVAESGRRCTGPSAGFNDYASSTWVHELFHNFGVSHTLDTPCDLMSGAETPGTCPSNQERTIDWERTRYVGSSLQGLDVLKLRVWAGYTDRQDLFADCSLDPVGRADGFNFAYCPTGIKIIGALKYCWTSVRTVVLQERVAGVWKSLGSGRHSVNPWGLSVDWECDGGTAPRKQITVTEPGIRFYRWVVNGRVAERFKVIWVR